MQRLLLAFVLAASAVAAGAQTALPPIQAPAAANPYGLGALWAQGDPVARFTILILAIMSLASWYVLITKLLAQSRMGGQGRAANQSFWKADSVQKGAEQLQSGSPYRFIAESALEAARSMLCAIQVLMSTLPIRPSCLRAASSADSAMKR